MSRPLLTIVAGSNGSGKSTLTAAAREHFQDNPVLDPDAIARSLRGSPDDPLPQLEAGKQVLRLEQELLQSRQSFTVETTLSGNSYLRLARQAKELGFDVLLIFVGTSSVEINLQRVKRRVRMGGHDVPEEDQRRRYPRTLANLERLLPLVDQVMLYDNSTPSGHRLVAVGQPGAMTFFGPIPGWATFVRGNSPE